MRSFAANDWLYSYMIQQYKTVSNTTQKIHLTATIKFKFKNNGQIEYCSCFSRRHWFRHKTTSVILMRGSNHLAVAINASIIVARLNLCSLEYFPTRIGDESELLCNFSSISFICLVFWFMLWVALRRF